MTLKDYYKGSPPRMRGKVLCPDAFAAAFRITPAYAGKSSVNGWPSFAIRDHPRVCGEKSLNGISLQW